MYDKIMIPLDGSKLSETALEHATSLAKSQSSELHLIRVWTRNEPLDSPYPVRRDWRGLPRKVEAYLQDVANGLREHGLQVWCHVLEGKPDDVITAAAKRENIGLIVMTSHGFSGITRWFLGSVAEAVVRHAPCPVMTIGKTYLQGIQEAKETTTPAASA